MKKWIWIIPFIIIIIGIGVWVGWMFMDSKNGEKNSGTNQVSGSAEEDISKDVINEPVSESIITFTSDEVPYRNGHHFISELHNFYNDTVCWGRLSTAYYSEQKEMAEHIIFVLENTETANKDITRDFDSIMNLANTLVKEDNRRAMRDLHRYFHDLDIYFNGYAYHQTFRITKFRGL